MSIQYYTDYFFCVLGRTSLYGITKLLHKHGRILCQLPCKSSSQRRAFTNKNMAVELDTNTGNLTRILLCNLLQMKQGPMWHFGDRDRRIYKWKVKNGAGIKQLPCVWSIEEDTERLLNKMEKLVSNENDKLQVFTVRDKIVREKWLSLELESQRPDVKVSKVNLVNFRYSGSSGRHLSRVYTF